MSAELKEYGIPHERSDYRCHVCFGEGNVYLFKTVDCVSIIESRAYKQVPAYQPGIKEPTAMGYLVPPADIPGAKPVKIPPDILTSVLSNINKSSPTTAKGSYASKVVRAMLYRGLLPVSILSYEITERRDQLDGIDLLTKQIRIQVKCDWDGGVNGTGNLYIQTHEANPLKRH